MKSRAYKGYKSGVRFTVSEALEDSRSKVFAPISKVCKEDAWRRETAQRFGDAPEDLTSAAYLGAISRLQKMSPDYEIGSGLVIRLGWLGYLDARRSKFYKDKAGSLDDIAAERDKGLSSSGDTTISALLVEDNASKAFERKEFLARLFADFARDTRKSKAIEERDTALLMDILYNGLKPREAGARRGINGHHASQVLTRFNNYILEKYTLEEFRELLFT